MIPIISVVCVIGTTPQTTAPMYLMIVMGILSYFMGTLAFPQPLAADLRIDPMLKVMEARPLISPGQPLHFVGSNTPGCCWLDDSLPIAIVVNIMQKRKAKNGEAPA